MTKREPFAVVVDDSSPGNPSFDVMIGAELIYPTDHEKTANMIARLINEAYESELKKAVREAVEAFRAKVGSAVWLENVSTSEYGSHERAMGGLEMQRRISHAIDALPTEPEGT